MTSHTGRVRPPAVAGAFYPADPGELARTVDGLLRGADPPANAAQPLALVVPHAGYVYSGPIAASAYATVAGERRFERVVVLGPSHRYPLRGLAAPSVDAFVTPLGLVQVDVSARRTLVARGLATVADAPHELEHSLEVQLPFLQRVLPDRPVLPVAVGLATPADAAAAIEAVWDAPTLVLVSTDLSHYEDLVHARAHDARTVEAVLALDADRLGPEDACGVYALRGLVRAARDRHCALRLLDLRTSGDTAGPPDRVVGYGAFAVEAA